VGALPREGQLEQADERDRENRRIVAGPLPERLSRAYGGPGGAGSSVAELRMFGLLGTSPLWSSLMEFSDIRVRQDSYSRLYEP